MDPVGSIRGKEDFIRFARDLAWDCQAHPEQWANTGIPDFLERMAAWVEDFSSSPANSILWEQVDFQTLALILYMGKLYE